MLPTAARPATGAPPPLIPSESGEAGGESAAVVVNHTADSGEAGGESAAVVDAASERRGG